MEIELHRNIFYCTKKKAVADLIQGRAARIVALVVEARHEATALQGMLDSCKTLEEMNQAVSYAIQIRYGNQSKKKLSCKYGNKLFLTPHTIMALSYYDCKLTTVCPYMRYGIRRKTSLLPRVF